MGMAAAMGLTLRGSLSLPIVRSRLRPSFSAIVTGVCAGLLHSILTIPAAALILHLQPQWRSAVAELYSWRAGHSRLFIGLTLPMIVLAEEVFWRGVIAQFLIERSGKLCGILLASAMYAAAHLAAFNPVLLLAAFACGLYWGLLYAATDNLTTTTLSHLIWDVLLLFALPVVP